MKTTHRFWQLTVFSFLMVFCVLYAVEVRGGDDIRLVSITTDGPSRIATGSTARYTCTATWSDGTTATVTPTWSVSAPNYNPTYGTVNSSGLVTNQNSTTEDQGIFVNARYTSNGVTVSASGTKTGKYVILEKKELRSIAISGPSSVATGSTAAYTCTATWSYGPSTTMTSNLTWSLNSTAHASVISTAGVVTNKNATTNDQMATLNASCTVNDVTKTAATSIMLEQKVLTGIVIDGPDTIESSDTATYTCMATWSYGSDTTVEPTWSVTPTTYANVDTTGTVTNNNMTETDQTVTLDASYTINDITMTASKSNITLAVPVPSYTLTVIGGSGSGVYKVGTDVTVTADDADDDYVFSSWIAEGIALDNGQLTSNPLTITMPDGDVTLTATYTSEYTYTVSGGKATITGYIGLKTDLVIPDTIDGYPVVAIGNGAFSGQMIYSVTIPEGVTSIGSYAFDWCWGLATVFIPASVTSIGANSFYGDMSLFSIDVDAANACYASVDGVLFNKSRTTLLRYPPAKEDAEYAIPSSVTTIESDAFESCNNLISMEIPEGVTSIGYEAFGQCYNLTSVTIPGSVASIENYTFYFCNNLASLTISEGVTSIGAGAFYSCYSLTSVTIPSSVTSIGDQAFYDCSNLTEMYFSGEPPTFAEHAYPTPITFYAEAGQGWEEWAVPSGVTLIIPEPLLESIAVFGDAIIATESTASYACSATWSDGTTATVMPTWTLSSTAYANVDQDGVVTNQNTTTTEQTVTLTAIYTAGDVTCESSMIITLEGVEENATQTLNLERGWNWVGFNVLPSSRKTADVLGTTGFTVNDVIQTNGGSARFTGTSWTPESFAIEYGKLYQIYVANDVEVVVNGVADGPSSLPLVAGWNWIANSTLEDVALSQLTHSGGWAENDRIQTAGGNGAAYISGKWIPSGFMLESGKGYQIYSANDGTLAFPTPDDGLYVVVDLSGGPEAARYPVRYSSVGPNLDDDTCRTTELWLRKIPAGTFIMGSPQDEVGRRSSDMASHQVTITDIFYIGVFECTQKQWELVMGNTPSNKKGDCRPVEQVSYSMIRGSGEKAGAGWPEYGHTVDATSFMGKLQAKTGLTFDLPTEAQREYACRAGTTTALYSGKNLTNSNEDAATSELARYRYNQSDGKGGYTSGHTKVGSYLPNAWGLFDMYGNADEWCLDWWGASTTSTEAEIDPVGPRTGSSRVVCCGGYDGYAYDCRSASRGNYNPSDYNIYFGFRIALHPQQDLYAVVDLSGGADATSYPVRYSSVGPNLNDDTCRTTELWLRKIPAGTFIMGSPEDEVGRNENDMAQHEVTLTQDYYIGVFECTQRQWELVMGTKPSYFNNATYYATRPVEKVSYNMIRGTGVQAGAGWPEFGHAVDTNSFMGKLQAKTRLTFDLPTEAQWEYACRAGTTTALNSGKNLTNPYNQDIAMDEVGRYYCNGGSSYPQNCDPVNGTAKVGSYLANSWGLYDMHGNVLEWCLDWWGGSTTSTAAEIDPIGPYTGTDRVKRGGSWADYPHYCRSADRSGASPTNSDFYYSYGFRIALHPKQDLYAVVDLSGGPDATSYPVRYTDTAPNQEDDTCRTTELWLRKIPAGTFMMGSPADEVGRLSDMTQHEVTLTQDFYIGVFECTQKQWELVMGSNPANYKGDCRPVEYVSYNMIRGTDAQAGAGWPTYGHAVDASSFMGKLQTKTGLVFDLPTEAQWEYACRAGTTTALNSGKNLTSIYSDVSMAEVGRYYYNQSDGKGGYSSQHTKVGSYLPNAWGLYDMHGNISELCLDWWEPRTSSMAAETDPVGPNTGSDRVGRGGSWGSNASNCRSAICHYFSPSNDYNGIGFRVALHPLNMYAIVDLSGGPEAASYPVRYTNSAPNLEDDTCRTTELWLRKIPAGTFIMGSQEGEVGRDNKWDMAQHHVTITNDYYIGVFECTQKQWEQVMGSNPSDYKGDCRPVENVSCNMIRGTGSQAGAGWPTYGHTVDATSFMGRLQAKTGLTFDLPTEAQWEYACRAGTTTALNSGKNLMDAYEEDANMAEVGRYWCNESDGNGGYSEHTKVGSYLRNAWGLYDMHGNVGEWCLDWWGANTSSTAAETDPVGPSVGSYRVKRDGGWGIFAGGCRSASRSYNYASYVNSCFGFRIACLP